jgi:hypothetical protein
MESELPLEGNTKIDPKVVQLIQSLSEHSRSPWRSGPITLTPEVAAALLSSSTHNRNIRQKQVNQFVRAIKENRWSLNGETLILDRTGTLRDGHHRCQAVVVAGLPIETFVVFGMDPSDFVTIDIGAARSGADMFKIQELPNAPALSAAATLLWQYLQFDEWRVREDREEGDGTKFFYQSCSNPERDQTFSEHLELRDSVELCQEALQGMRFISAGTLAFVHYLGRQAAGEQIATTFVRAVAAGPNLGLEKDNPAMVLRKRLMESQEKSSTRLSQLHRLVFTIKSFNAFAKDEPIYRLSWARKGERNPEEFPAFVNMDEVLKARSARERRAERPHPDEADQILE